ncbi:MAG TPA: tetratricopeptide repeat protein, partial [Micromonosporaceae bacterium]
ALVHQSMTHYVQAITLHEEALQIARALPDPLLEAWVLINTAQTYQRAGRSNEALAYLDQAAEPARQCRNTAAQATALDVRGQVLIDLGDHHSAQRCQEFASKLRHQLES